MHVLPQDLQAAITACSCKTSAVRSCICLYSPYSTIRTFANGHRRTIRLSSVYMRQHATDLLRWQRVKWTALCLWWRKQISALLKCEMKYNLVKILCIYVLLRHLFAALHLTIRIMFLKKIVFLCYGLAGQCDSWFYTNQATN